MNPLADVAQALQTSSDGERPEQTVKVSQNHSELVFVTSHDCMMMYATALRMVAEHTWCSDLGAVLSG